MDLSQTEDLLLPKLRQDLSIHEGGPEMDGSPTWMVYDPVSDNYFKIGWFEFECLKRWEKCQSSSQLMERLRKETKLNPDLNDINDFIYFLLLNKLLGSHNLAVRQFLQKEKDRKKPNLFYQLTTRYLYFRLPLFRPQHRLEKIYPMVAPLFSKGFFILTCVMFLAALFITLQRVDEFFLTFTNFFNAENIILIFIATIFIKLVHEMGHAFVAVKYNVPISSIGIAFIVMYPIFYTETTNAWRLYDRKKRMHIAAAGVMAEMFLAAVALLAWNTLPPGFLQNLAFYIGFLSLLASVLINMNPLLKFDGYYLLTDYIGIDNLQDRSIAMFKWRLRRILFGFKAEPPENADTHQGRFLQGFGLALVIYRFFLYMGIAILVYHLVFKPLGLILFIVEIIWFILLPLYKEVAYWFIEREQIFQNARGRFTILFVILLSILAFLPINSTIKLPAVIYAGEYYSAFTPVPAKIVDINVQNNQRVAKGDVLIRLVSPTINYQILETRTQLEYYTTIRERLQTRRELLNEDLTIDQTIAEYQTKLKGLQRLKNDLLITAPFDGIIKDLQPHVHRNRWINPSEALLRVIQDSGTTIAGYVNEDDIRRVELDDQGEFYAHTVFSDGIPVYVNKIAKKDTRDLAYPEMATIYGGLIPADQDSKTSGLVARRPLYSVQFSFQQQPEDNLVQNNTKLGVIFLKGEPVSLIEKITTDFVSLVIREVNL